MSHAQDNPQGSVRIYLEGRGTALGKWCSGSLRPANEKSRIQGIASSKAISHADKRTEEPRQGPSHGQIRPRLKSYNCLSKSVRKRSARLQQGDIANNMTEQC